MWTLTPLINIYTITRSIQLNLGHTHNRHFNPGSHLINRLHLVVVALDMWLHNNSHHLLTNITSNHCNRLPRVVPPNISKALILPKCPLSSISPPNNLLNQWYPSHHQIHLKLDGLVQNVHLLINHVVLVVKYVLLIVLKTTRYDYIIILIHNVCDELTITSFSQVPGNVPLDEDEARILAGLQGSDNMFQEVSI